MKKPRAPRRRQVEVDAVRATANDLRRELAQVRKERKRYRDALVRISKDDFKSPDGAAHVARQALDE